MTPRFKILFQRAILGALGAERLQQREVALVAFVWQQDAAVERRQRQRRS